jgi:hypothetical protein
MALAIETNLRSATLRSVINVLVPASILFLFSPVC